MSNNIRYCWLRDKQNNPVACIALRDFSNYTIEFALAAYNPIDKFSKKLAREIAAGRLEAHHETFTVEKEGNVKVNVLHLIYNHSESVQLFPTAVRHAAKYRLKIYKPGPRVQA